METLYKVLAENGSAFHGGNGTWNLPKGKRPGKWMEPIVDPVPCQRGYHLCRLADLPQWIGPTIYVAEGRGDSVDHGDKVVFSQARLVSRTVWDKAAMVQWAADCAEHVLSK